MQEALRPRRSRSEFEIQVWHAELRFRANSPCNHMAKSLFQAYNRQNAIEGDAMRVFGVISYIILAIITAYPALLSCMVYDSSSEHTFLKVYVVASFAALPAGFFIGQIGFLPYQSEIGKKMVYLPLVAFVNLVFLFTVAAFLNFP